MRQSKLLISVVMLAASFSIAHAKPAVELDGSRLTLEQARQIAQGEADVKIAPSAIEKLKKSYTLVLAAAKGGTPVYGLTVGVGLNKDQALFDAKGELSPAVLDASKAFNQAMILSHSAGVGPMMDEALVRMTMVVRLNTLLNGQTGSQPYVAELYQRFLNRGLTPVVPARGTVGEGDITIASHIGAVMVGQWQAKIDGKTVSGAEALRIAGLKPLDIQGKDGLAILSTNAPSVAQSINAVLAARQIVRATPRVYALSLEALNGNVAPFLPQTIGVRPFPGLAESAKTLRDTLAGSYLWVRHPQRSLQDPLSFRDQVYVITEMERALRDAEQMLAVQINSSDDNPATVLDADRAYSDRSQVAMYFVDTPQAKGGIFPSANFEILPVALAVQRLTLALAHASATSVQRTIHLSDDGFTKLPRFLAAPGNAGHAFGAIQKPFVALHAENVDLANPVSLDVMPVAGNIEDIGTNNDAAARRLHQVADNLAAIYGLEMLHAAQAIDLRLAQTPAPTLSKSTQAMHRAYREKVAFVKQDRIFTPDIAASTRFVQTYSAQ
ncbi:MAG: aromatic amino acid ammonia-lyase [Burkholderiaceae bacterium]